MAVYAIGDIQGCFAELQRLLERLRFDPADDRLWFAGDLVNRGPQSLETLRFVRELGDRAVSVLGNHDLHLLAGAYHTEHIKKKDTLHPILEAPDRDELIDWLRQRPLLHHDAELGYTLIHAGLPPQWDLATAQACAREMEAVLRGDACSAFLEVMYGDRPDRWDAALEGWDRLRFITNCFTRLRYCTPDGTLGLAYKGPPGSQPPPYRPWFEIEERRSRELNILFGHWSTLGRVRAPGVFPLDTGCLWGGELTALRLDGPPRWLQIDCPGALRPGDD
ncbi:symmetrical bis(5'-nucleosyl)-tetraphosphatase [Thiohalobacter sp. IOR34]|uniref:symmetrical bis(5'-nucleosyl)-tetraphosphatase n=1 Tax=Thiohalobacter sp. IOR34 TaxID=3057176 RepID=UPI0025B25CE3|nr:symmetrical bis(5'-nucleosyl)-tetraphosphatase [Thiohalobacter sp. IOR34]WJW75898.1 symmetrical bis(5'-nucleosyl)-tetraphosphatase [Thiohalobacter sp. IOR34]